MDMEVVIGKIRAIDSVIRQVIVKEQVDYTLSVMFNTRDAPAEMMFNIFHYDDFLRMELISKTFGVIGVYHRSQYPQKRDDVFNLAPQDFYFHINEWAKYAWAEHIRRLYTQDPYAVLTEIDIAINDSITVTDIQPALDRHEWYRAYSLYCQGSREKAQEYFVPTIQLKFNQEPVMLYVRQKDGTMYPVPVSIHGDNYEAHHQLSQFHGNDSFDYFPRSSRNIYPVSSLGEKPYQLRSNLEEVQPHIWIHHTDCVVSKRNSPNATWYYCTMRPIADPVRARITVSETYHTDLPYQSKLVVGHEDIVDHLPYWFPKHIVYDIPFYHSRFHSMRYLPYVVKEQLLTQL